MTPAARLQAAIELLQAIEADGRGADRVMGAYFRARRYMGSGDRNKVRERVYGVLRRHARLDWHLARIGLASSPRARVLADAVIAGGAEADSLFSGLVYAPAVLDPNEAHAVALLTGRPLEDASMPPHAVAECPDWVLPKLRHLSLEELAALNVPAPVDLRVNALKATREAAAAALAEAKIETAPTPLSPLGLRLSGRVRLDSTAAYRDGLVEVQDEGSQLAALLLGAKPGMTVLDWCAGAGGKTLAIAAEMKGRGRLVAGETSAARLANLAERATRAGVDFIETAVPPEALEIVADRVLVDAPCSGSGTWRRHPEAKWKLSPEALAGYVRAQREILAAAAARVAPGGVLLYVVCSLLAEEGADQVAAFLAVHRDFARVSAREMWARAIGTAAPAGAGDGDLLLTPARHGTDGFFVAAFERVP